MKKVFKLGCFGLIGLIALIVIIGVVSSGDEQVSNDAQSEETTSKDESKKDNKNDKKEKKSDKGSLTEKKFKKIKDGMTYEEVVDIVGADGKIISETGEKGSEFHTVMYEFKTDGFLSNSTMMFQGDKLINKSQFGLGGGSDVKMTLDQFNQMENGMTLEEVIKIVGGEGEVISESGEKGTDLHTVMYSYNGKGDIGANVSLMFQGNKLQNKTQFGLK